MAKTVRFLGVAWFVVVLGVLFVSVGGARGEAQLGPIALLALIALVPGIGLLLLAERLGRR